MAKKIKYFYNTETLKYEKVEKNWKQVLLRAVGFVCATLISGLIFLVFVYKFLDSPKEKTLKAEIEQLNYQYDLMEDRLKDIDIILKDLQGRDDNIYRVIFEAEPIPISERRSNFGDGNKYKQLDRFSYGKLIKKTLQRLDIITKEIYIQSKSYEELNKLARNKNKFFSSIPAIQPISNKSLRQMASGYGYRIHPVYKTVKFHAGMDFTAPTGTPIYATGDGVVKSADNQGRGYGNHVIINHGYGYETLYAHMSKFAIRSGQRVKRGQVIGYVGSTGLSTAPHLHYEVHKFKKILNPISFYYNDLSPVEYEKMIELSNNSNQSFD